MLLARRGYSVQLFSLQRFRLIASANSLYKEIHKNHRTYHVGVLEQCLEISNWPDVKKIEGENLKTESSYSYGGRLVHNSTPEKELNVSEESDGISGWRNLSSYGKGKPLSVGKNSYREVLSISRELDNIVTLDYGVVANILQACIGSEVSLHFVQLLHAKIICCGFNTSPHVCNRLMDLYLKNVCVDSADQIFKSTRARDNVSWVAMISGLSRNFHELDSIQLYCEMRRLGVFPTPYVFLSIISSCAKRSLYKVGQQLHYLILKWGFSTELYVCNSLVSLYSRCGYLTSAELIFSEMEQRDRVSFNTLISGFSMRGSADKSQKLFEKMLTESLKPDSVTVAILLGSCVISNEKKNRKSHTCAPSLQAPNNINLFLLSKLHTWVFIFTLTLIYHNNNKLIKDITHNSAH